jgi:thioredoxin-related protein
MKQIKMKSFFLSLALALPAVMMAQQAEIKWMTIEEVEVAQKKQPRKVIMDVYTSWCGPCKMMMQNTFSNADVINYINKNYYAVKFDAEGPKPVKFKGNTYSNPDYDPNRQGRNGTHQFSRYMGVSAYPTIIYLDENLDVITPIPGYKGPQDIEIFLKFFAENKYKTVTTQEQWNDYQANFKGTFK